MNYHKSESDSVKRTAWGDFAGWVWAAEEEALVRFVCACLRLTRSRTARERWIFWLAGRCCTKVHRRKMHQSVGALNGARSKLCALLVLHSFRCNCNWRNRLRPWTCMSPKQNFRNANKPIWIEKFEKMTFVEESLYLFAKEETAGTA